MIILMRLQKNKEHVWMNIYKEALKQSSWHLIFCYVFIRLKSDLLLI